ncbi:hypothetical protein B0T24DRAFT_617904 [Lasiosphaeria ovina]|uniref:Uncharacterized protein n=1 Tax=Lasiosphaeria ovina TaxID=92902 RepID=A0AAE0KGE2_9PEZI|nr:hypothetical protein B0T24DRAFT_617904 [Lasiosphaeria ovina]
MSTEKGAALFFRGCVSIAWIGRFLAGVWSGRYDTPALFLVLVFLGWISFSLFLFFGGSFAAFVSLFLLLLLSGV